MRKEIWFGKEYLVEKFTYGDSCCTLCAFHDTENCQGVKCSIHDRADGTNVYYTEVETDDIIVDTEHNVYTSIGWMEMAAQGQRDVEFYQCILNQIGELLGIAAYTSDDGSIQDSVLRIKLPELVAKLVYENVSQKSKIASLELELHEF